MEIVCWIIDDMIYEFTIDIVVRHVRFSICTVCAIGRESEFEILIEIDDKWCVAVESTNFAECELWDAN